MRLFALGALLITSVFAQDRFRSFQLITDGGAAATVGTDPVSPIRFSASTIQRDGTVMHLKGNVVVNFGDKTVQADEVDYHWDTGAIDARGGVKLIQVVQVPSTNN